MLTRKACSERGVLLRAVSLHPAIAICVIKTELLYRKGNRLFPVLKAEVTDPRNL
jgi:hypothetical protein